MTYEYRVVSKNGLDDGTKESLEAAQEVAAYLNTSPMFANQSPYTIQRRLVAEWEPLPDKERTA